MQHKQHKVKFHALQLPSCVPLSNIFISGPGTDPISLLIFFVLRLVAATLFKKVQRLHRFKSNSTNWAKILLYYCFSISLHVNTHRLTIFRFHVTLSHRKGLKIFVCRNWMAAGGRCCIDSSVLHRYSS